MASWPTAEMSGSEASTLLSKCLPQALKMADMTVNSLALILDHARF